MIGHSSSRSIRTPSESGHFLVALRSHPLPACPLCLLLFSEGLSLCLCCCLLLFPQSPLFPNTLHIFWKFRGELAELIELEGKGVIHGGLEMLKLVQPPCSPPCWPRSSSPC